MSTVFIMDDIIVRKREVVTTVTGSIIPVGYFQKNKYVINFTIDYMVPKFEAYTDHTLDTLHKI